MDEDRGTGKSALVKTLRVISQMHSAGVIGRYAIGGAVGAAFYVEPAATLDVDVFVGIPEVSGKAIITPGVIYEYLRATWICARRGFGARGRMAGSVPAAANAVGGGGDYVCKEF